MTVAFYSSYVQGGRRAGQVRRLHIIREDGKFAGRQALCGQHAWSVQNADPVKLDPMPDTPPPGLSWCPKCIGHLAERLGALDAVATQLAHLDPRTTWTPDPT